MKRILCIFLGALMSLSIGSSSLLAHSTKYENREVQAGTTFLEEESFSKPVIQLWKAIEKDEKAARFRISWHDGAMSVYYVGTVLYDREKRVLKYYELSGHGDANLHEKEHYMISGVSDKTLQTLAANISERTKKKTKYSSCFRYLGDDGYKIKELK